MVKTLAFSVWLLNSLFRTLILMGALLLAALSAGHTRSWLREYAGIASVIGIWSFALCAHITSVIPQDRLDWDLIEGPKDFRLWIPWIIGYSAYLLATLLTCVYLVDLLQ